MTLREVHLFAGVGGGILGGLLLGHTCVAAVEIDSYCREVLHARQADGCLPPFPIYQRVDVGREQRQLWADPGVFRPGEWRGRADVVAGGFPCQPWSVAGRRRGAADHRHLWPAMRDVVDAIRPAWVFCENVALEAFTEPWRDLRAMGYLVPPAVRLGSGDLGFAARRWRWWLLGADPVRVGCAQEPQGHSAKGDVDLAPRPDLGRLARKARRLGDRTRAQRIAGRAPHRLDRLRACGNAQVPAVAAAAWQILMARVVADGK